MKTRKFKVGDQLLCYARPDGAPADSPYTVSGPFNTFTVILARYSSSGHLNQFGLLVDIPHLTSGGYPLTEENCKEFGVHRKHLGKRIWFTDEQVVVSYAKGFKKCKWCNNAR